MGVVIAKLPVPVYRKTSSFGPRDSGFHWGIDLGASTAGKIGDIITTVQAGTVRRISYDSDGYGNYVVIEHTMFGFCTLYAHLSKVMCSEGDILTSGGLIGLMGSTGRSTGAHLHFEIRNVPYSQFWKVSRNRAYVLDPEPYLSGKKSGSDITTVENLGTIPQQDITYTYEKISVDKNSVKASGNYLYGRKYRIMAFDENNNGYDISDLHVVFSVNKSLTRENSTGTVTIYNLNVTTENELLSNCVRVTIEAGYEGLFGLIYDGDVIQGIRGIENGTDYYLTLISMDCERFLNSGFVSYTIARGVNKREAVDTICKVATNPVQVNSISSAISEQKYIRGKVVFGKAQNYLNQIAVSEGANFYTEDGKVNLTTVKDLDESRMIYLDSTSGLIGNPQQNAEGIEFQCLLNPRIKLNSLVNIPNNQIIEQQYSDGNAIVYQLDADSVYRVIRISFEGDTRGQSWYTKCTATSQAGAIPTLMADIISATSGYTNENISANNTGSPYNSESYTANVGGYKEKPFKAYMDYRTITSKGTLQYKYQHDKKYGVHTDGQGFRRMPTDGLTHGQAYYMVAMGSYFGRVGTKLFIELSEGRSFYAILGDQKADKDTDSLHMYAKDGSVIEFIVDQKVLYKMCPKVKKMGDCSYANFKGTIKKLTTLVRK